MSTPDPRQPRQPEPRGQGARRVVDATLFVVVPAALAVTFAAVLVAEGEALEVDLQLVTPYSVAPGTEIAARAVVYDRSRDLPRKIAARVSLELRAPGGEVLARAVLEPSPSGDAEGLLGVPPDAPRGELQLRALVSLADGREAAVLRPLDVEEPPRPFGTPGRMVHPLRAYELFPLEGPAGESPPALDVRVPGGGCVPEARCELTVDMGEPPSALAIEPVFGVAQASPPEPSGETSGVVRVAVVVHGPEAELRAVALRAGAPAGSRRVRLPVQLGGLAATLDRAFAPAPHVPRLRVEGHDGARPVVIDAFREGIWARTGTVAADALTPVASAPFAPLGPGLWALQIRHDGAEPSSAAVRHVCVRQGGSDPDGCVRDLARRAGAADPPDPYARRAPADGANRRAEAEHMLALVELDVRPDPPASIASVQAAVGIDERRGRLRWGAALAFALAGIFVAAIVLRRGLGASAQARALLREAGDEGVDDPRRRLRSTLTIVAVVVAVALAFLAAAVLVVARGLV